MGHRKEQALLGNKRNREIRWLSNAQGIGRSQRAMKAKIIPSSPFHSGSFLPREILKMCRQQDHLLLDESGISCILFCISPTCSGNQCIAKNLQFLFFLLRNFYFKVRCWYTHLFLLRSHRGWLSVQLSFQLKCFVSSYWGEDFHLYWWFSTFSALWPFNTCFSCFGDLGHKIAFLATL